MTNLEAKDIEKQIEDMVHEVWHLVTDIANRVLDHAHVLGFNFMDVPHPSVHDFIRILDIVLIPTIDRILSCGDVPPLAGMKLINVNQYYLRLRQISFALKDADEIAFTQAVEDLRRDMF